MDRTDASPRVLLVEDEALISALVEDALSEHGFDVHVAVTAKEALEYLMGGSQCDVLFTDINLPGSINGAALAQIARMLRPGLPVVYASGLMTAIEQFDAVPGAAFVAKPYDPEKVCALLQGCTAAHR